MRSYKWCPLAIARRRGFPAMVLSARQCFHESSGFIGFASKLSRLAHQRVSLFGKRDRQVNGVGLSSKLGVVSCPPSCHNISRCFCGVVLQAVFRAASPGIFRHLPVGSAKACFLTQRAPDKWDSPRFTGSFLASSFSAPKQIPIPPTCG